MFGGPSYDYVENKNHGYSFGFGLLNLFKLGSFNTTEILMGFESQQLKLREYYPKSIEEIDFINQNYNTYFLQLNIIKQLKNKKLKLGYGLKISYFKLKSLENQFYYENNLQTKNLDRSNLFLIAFSSNLEYKLMQQKQLFLRFQTSTFGALEDFEYDVNSEGFWGMRFNVGLLYKL